MQKFLKYGLVPCVIILGILIGVIVIYNREDKKTFLEESDIIINQVTSYEDITSDLDVKIVSSICDCIYDDYAGYKLPDDLRLNQDYGVLVKDASLEYNIVHDYVFEFIGNNDRWVHITYSMIEEPLKDYFITSDSNVSVIDGVEVLLYQYEEQYIVDFKYNDMYYEIEANHVTLEELLTLIRGIFQDSDELNVNEIDEVYSSEVDSDVRITNVVDSTVDVNIPWEFDDFGIPKVYFTSTSELFIHDLRYEYKNGEQEFTVAFSSIEEPIRDYYFLSDGEESFIHGVCMSIYQHENIYYVEFKINNHYYDVETTNMNEEELLEILEVIINSEIKNT